MIDLTPLSPYLRPNKIKIGVSANSGAHTNELIQGVSLAMQDALRADNKIAKKISLVWKNDFRNKIDATNVAEEFSKENVKYVIGHLSASSSIPASKIYNKDKILFFATGTTHPELCTHTNQYTFRICPLDVDQAKIISNLVYDKFNNFRIHLITQDIAYGHSLSTNITNLLKNKIASNIIINNAVDTNKSIEKYIIDNNIDNNSLIIICAIHEYTAKYINLIKQYTNAQYFILGDDSDIPNFLDLINCNNLEMYVPQISFNNNILSNIQLLSLEDRYIKIRNEFPGAYFYTSYIAFTILIDMLSNIETYSIHNLIKNNFGNKKFPITFDPYGNAKEIFWKIKHMQL